MCCILFLSSPLRMLLVTRKADCITYKWGLTYCLKSMDSPAFVDITQAVPRPPPSGIL